jgi:hypothetical protein
MNQTLVIYGAAAILMLYIFAPIALFGLLLSPVIGDWAIISTFAWVGIGPFSLVAILEYLEKRKKNGLR